jgi:hypothetical protein
MEGGGGLRQKREDVWNNGGTIYVSWTGNLACHG